MLVTHEQNPAIGQSAPGPVFVKNAQEWFFTFLKSCRKERKGKERKESLTNSEILINRSFLENVCQSLSLIILVHSLCKYVMTAHSMLNMCPNSADGDTGTKEVGTTV